MVAVALIALVFAAPPATDGAYATAQAIARAEILRPVTLRAASLRLESGVQATVTKRACAENGRRCALTVYDLP
ncbi:MAG: hypothetical protein H0X36_03925 [Sphingomonadaceae bacterium]|nr:hypothetical protein [Sphingomonadaceae bacterium]